MSDVNLLNCPNCGGSDFVDIAPRKHRCAYCGTVLTSPEPAPTPVRCSQCGFENELGDRYCKRCGASLPGWAPVTKPKNDPGLVSIIVTVVGTFFIPMVGAAIGLVLAYRALKEARATDGRSGSEKLARTAVLVGWAGIAFGLLPMCFVVTTSGVQMGIAACDGLFEALSDMLPAGLVK